MEIKSKYIKGVEALTDEQVRAAMLQIQSQPVDKVNWEEYPYKPEVNVRVAHSDTAIAVMFSVTEDHVRAITLEDNGPVWEDSCVEFFVKSPKRPGYFNFEINCIGTALAAYRHSRTDAEHFPAKKMDLIRRITSLPHVETDNMADNQSWTLIEIIPFELIDSEGIPEELSVNFYKCGDNCEPTHFLSWNPINLPAPNFHCPEFFGKLIFK